MCIKAVISVAYLDPNPFNLELIKVYGKVGGKLECIRFVDEIVIDKGFSQLQMPDHMDVAKVFIFTFSLELSTPKTKQGLNNLTGAVRRYARSNRQ